MSYLSRLDKTARILRPIAATGWGQRTQLSLVSEVPCRMQVSSGSEAVEGRIRGEVSWQVFLPAGTSLQNTDVIEVDGIQFDVIPPIADAAGAGHHVEVWVKEHI